MKTKTPLPAKRGSAAAVPLAPSPGESISGYVTYEDYLDAQITPLDLYYLEDTDLARQLVEHGYRGNAEILSREEFKSLKDAAELARIQALRKAPKKVFSEGKDLDDSPFLKALAEREVLCRDGKLATIIFVRDVHPRGHEVIAESDAGIQFKNKIDRKIINVNPNSPPGDLTTRIEIDTDEYKSVILYDHQTRDM